MLYSIHIYLTLTLTRSKNCPDSQPELPSVNRGRPGRRRLSLTSPPPPPFGSASQNRSSRCAQWSALLALPLASVVDLTSKRQMAPRRLALAASTLVGGCCVGVASAQQGFVPVSTDCIKWIKIDSSVHLEPGTTYPGSFNLNQSCGEMHCFDPLAPVLTVGHQVCMEETSDGHGGALLFPTGGAWGELLCMTLNGSMAGHVDFSNHSAGFSCFDVASTAKGMSCVSTS